VRLTLFIGIALEAVALVLSFYRRLAPGDRLPALSLGMILGGAVGDLIDRVFVEPPPKARRAPTPRESNPG